MKNELKTISTARLLAMVDIIGVGNDMAIVKGQIMAELDLRLQGFYYSMEVLQNASKNGLSSYVAFAPVLADLAALAEWGARK